MLVMCFDINRLTGCLSVDWEIDSFNVKVFKSEDDDTPVTVDLKEWIQPNRSFSAMPPDQVGNTCIALFVDLST